MDEAPTKVIAGVTSGWQRLRVVDATTGEAIDRICEADADAGTVTRMVADDAGNLKRDGDRFVTETQQRAIRIEWIESEAEAAPVPAPVPEAEVAQPIVEPQMPAPVAQVQPESLAPNTPTTPVVG